MVFFLLGQAGVSDETFGAEIAAGDMLLMIYPCPGNTEYMYCNQCPGYHVLLSIPVTRWP